MCASIFVYVITTVSILVIILVPRMGLCTTYVLVLIIGFFAEALQLDPSKTIPHDTMGKVQTPTGAPMETSRRYFSKLPILVVCAPFAMENSARKFVAGGELCLLYTSDAADE